MSRSTSCSTRASPVPWTAGRDRPPDGPRILVYTSAPPGRRRGHAEPSQHHLPAGLHRLPDTRRARAISSCRSCRSPHVRSARSPSSSPLSTAAPSLRRVHRHRARQHPRGRAEVFFAGRGSGEVSTPGVALRMRRATRTGRLAYRWALGGHADGGVHGSRGGGRPSPCGSSTGWPTKLIALTTSSARWG